MFKAIHGIYWQCLIIREVNGFNDSSAPVRSVAQKAYKAVYFTIAGKLDSDFFAFTVFSVNLRYISACELLQKTDSSLGNVITVRYDIIYLAHVVQVFD